MLPVIKSRICAFFAAAAGIQGNPAGNTRPTLFGYNINYAAFFHCILRRRDKRRTIARIHDGQTFCRLQRNALVAARGRLVRSIWALAEEAVAAALGHLCVV